MAQLDAAVVGSGPNGLVAAITLARAGRSVLVLEAAGTPGGGTRTAELTLPGFHHDICSSVHPLLTVSQAMRTVDLEDNGVELLAPQVALAHPMDNGRAAALTKSIEKTGATLGIDSERYGALISPLLGNSQALLDSLFAPIVRVPRHPIVMARFGLRVGARSSQSLASRFRGEAARSLLAGLAGHSLQPLDAAGTGAIATAMAICAHVADWPVVRGGSQRIADALVAILRQHGGEIECGRTVRSLADIPASQSVLFDTSARQLADIAGDALPHGYARRLRRFKYGPGVFKLDYALDGPIPWTADECRQAGTVHLGGTFEEIAAAEHAVSDGRHPERPFVILAQASVVDPSRAPQGKHTLWAYCHVPNGSTVDMSEAIERQIERFAPGFRDLILARHVMNTNDVEKYNANYTGGDISAGAQNLRQIIFRPTFGRSPYRTPNPRLFLCSASTPPGGGVHGQCGWHAAQLLR